MPKIDLHFHSTYSDGKLSVPELATLLKMGGLKYCALTDHDSIAGINELKKCLQGTDITVIPGVELTALYGNNVIHILAYDFDVKIIAEILKERNDLVNKQKIGEMQKAIVLFAKEGLKISPDLLPDWNKPAGYTLALDICGQRFNQEIFIKRHGKELTTDEIYYEYCAPGKSCAVDRSGVSVKWLISRLKNVASDFILAHPFIPATFVSQPLLENDIFSLLRIGLSGVEVYHENTSEERIGWLKRIVKEKKLNYTGGSDFHGKIHSIALGMYGEHLEIPNFKLSDYEFK